MSILFRADDTRTTGAPVFAGDGACQADGAGLYLTDGVFLYRVVRVVGSGRGEMVELEDCYLLDVVLVPIGEVRARRLRVVTPAPVERQREVVAA
jgi:hypothetical protein